MTTATDYFHSLSQLSKDFSTTKDQDKLLNLIIKCAVSTLEAKAAAIFLMNDESEQEGENIAVARIGLSDKYINAGLDHAETMTSQLLKDGYLYFRNAATDPRLINHETKKVEGIGSILTVPVTVKKKILGMLSLYTHDIRDFTPDDIEFLVTLARQGVIAVGNIQLYNKLRNNTAMFLNIAASISSSLEIKRILQTLTEDIAKNFGVKAASIRLLDEDNRILKLVSSFGLSEKYLKKGEISTEKSIALAMKGEPVLVKNAARDEQVQYRKEKLEEGIVSILCVPIKSQDKVIGVLRLYSDRKRDFTKDEITFVTALAYQGGLAIQNASLYLTVQEDIKGLQQDIWSSKSWF